MSCNCQDVAERGTEKVENSFVMELLKGYVKSAKRWSDAFFVVLICLVVTICSIIWFFNQYNLEATTTTEISQEGSGTNSIAGVDIN